MHRFWDTIIEPVLEKLQPKSIVEIGSDNGKNTRNLLEFCEKHGGTLHAVDPLPKFDVVAWQERYKDIFIFHQSLSLNAIPKIEWFDVILIDGDHNWYTVFNELRLIEKKCTNLKQPFPLVMIHDTSWPYSRRDLYYDPETIPPKYLKPYKKKGMKPGSTELLEKGGLNSHLCNAIYENDLQNGVLTAIEDFMEESEQELEFVKFPALHGLGILFPLQLKEKNAELQKFFKALFMSPVVAGFLEQVEKSLTEVTIGREEKGKALEKLKAARKEEIENLQASLEERAEVVKVKDEELSQIKGALQEAEAAVGIVKEEARILQAGINERGKELKKKDEEFTDIQRKLVESKESEAKQKEEIESLQASLEERAEVVKVKDEELSQIKGALQEAEAAVGIVKEEARILQAGINERGKALKKKDEEFTDIQRKLVESKESEAKQKEEIESLQANMEERAEVLKAKNEELSQIKEVLQEAEAAIGIGKEEARILQAGINERDKALKKKDEELTDIQRELAESKESQARQKKEIERLQSEIREQSQDIKQLIRWIEQLDHNIEAILKSKRWSFGNTVGELLRRVMFKAKVPMAIDYLEKIRGRFLTWKKSYKDGKNRIIDVKNISSPRSAVSVQRSKKSFSNFPSTSSVAGSRRVDIIVCVHNALDDVKVCLESIIKNTSGKYRLCIINDGSNEVTTEYLRGFSSDHRSCTLLEHSVARGYTKAANKGLRASTADYVVLLNSDTIVPPMWLERLIKCGGSDPNIGILGPLSNAASWQSVPAIFQGNDFAINELPIGMTVEEMADLIEEVSQNSYPRVSFVNGFCFVIKRNVIKKIGYLDEKNFPYGYGEENDYCLRAINAGFELTIADNAYVYHAKSRSFGHSTRKELSKQGSILFRKKHGNKRIDTALKEMRENKKLVHIRENIDKRFDHIEAQCQGKHAFSAMFILPVHGGGGGSHSVVQESLGLMRIGVNVCIANKKSHKPYFLKAYSKVYETYPSIFFFYNDEQELIEYATRYNVVVATVYHSVKVLHKIIKAHPHIAPGYYIQDYEPWFFEENTAQWQEAYNSYTLISEMLLFAKTRWLCRTIEEHHDVRVEKISPGLDHDIFYPKKSFSQKKWPVNLSAMVRPNTARRGPTKTMRLLNKLKKEFGERVNVHIFGCDEQSPDYQNLERDFKFINHGVLERGKVADLLRDSDIFIDLSDFQAFGRTGLEAMACGCTTILPVKGGVHEFAIDFENSLLVDTASEQECETKVRKLIIDNNLRIKLRNNGLLKATEYSVRKAVLSEFLLLESGYKRWDAKHAARSRRSYKSKGLSVAGLLPYTKGGTFGGSAYIRVILPLTHSGIKDRLVFRTVNFKQIFKEKSNIVLVQRNAIQSMKESQTLVNYCIHQHIPMVYEIDDNLFRIHDGHEESMMYKTTMEANKFFAMNADLVIVSSENLKKNINHINSNIKVIPNLLDEKLWLKNDCLINSRHKSKNIRILYQGTATHYEDLMLIEKPFKKLKEKYGNKLTLDIIGIVLPTKNNLDWCNIIEVPNNAKKDYPRYVRWIANNNQWHIGIVPLVDNDFNRCKSYIKFLDYSALGLATVASDLGFYKNIIIDEETGLLVKNSETTWYWTLDKIIMDTKFRIAIANNAHQELKTNHILKVSRQWREVFEEILQ